MTPAFDQHEIDYIMKRKHELHEFLASSIPSGMNDLIRSGVAVVTDDSLQHFLRTGKQYSGYLDIYFLDAKIDNKSYDSILKMDTSIPRGLRQIKAKAKTWEEFIERNKLFSLDEDKEPFLTDMKCDAAPVVNRLISMCVRGYRARTLPRIETVYLNLSPCKSVREMRDAYAHQQAPDKHHFCTYYTTNKWHISKDAFDYIMHHKDMP